MDSPLPPPPLDRLFNRDRRLTQMPVNRQLRAQLLGWIVTLLPEGVELTETEVNNLLRPVDDDVATLRRYLVDHGLLERPRPGTYLRRPTG